MSFMNIFTLCWNVNVALRRFFLMNSYFDVLCSKKSFNSTPSTQHFSFPAESFSYVIVQPSNSEVKFSSHLKSPLLKVKKKIKGTKFSGTPMMEGWAWCPSEILQTQVQTCPRRAYRKHLCLQLCENSGPSFGLLN